MQCRLSRPVTAHAKSCARSLASQLRTVLQQLFWALNNSKESCLLHSHSCFSTLIMSEPIPRSSLLEWKEPKSAQWHSEDFSRIFQMLCIVVSVMPCNLGCWLTHNLHVPGSPAGSLTWPAYCSVLHKLCAAFLSALMLHLWVCPNMLILDSNRSGTYFCRELHQVNKGATAYQSTKTIAILVLIPSAYI